jgi:hypothetical protein
MAIRNTEFFEVLLPDAMQKYGLADDITVDRDGHLLLPRDGAGCIASHLIVDELGDVVAVSKSWQ